MATPSVSYNRPIGNADFKVCVLTEYDPYGGFTTVRICDQNPGPIGRNKIGATLGMGCHQDPEQALADAFSEATSNLIRGLR